MSWEKYLGLTVRTRWVMHEELAEMVNRKPGDEDDEEGATAEPHPKRMMR